ncbi:MAG: ABC transporter ATP-binding protein [Pseudomonadota bacterium]
MELLEVTDIHTYYGKSYILQGITLNVPRMKISALLGRNGAGKTTTIKSIIGLVPPSKGKIVFRGTDITGMPTFKVARLGISHVPEGRHIFPHLSVGENLVVSQRQYKDRSKWDLERIFKFFPILQTRWNQKGRQLSGGEQQMLALARGLAMNPDLLLLDEPSQGLAPLLVKQFSGVMKDLKGEQVTMLLVEQNMKMAEAVADNIFIIIKGRIVYEGDIDDFKSREKELRTKFLSV